MTTNSIVDVESLVKDLQRAVRYAAKAGLLRSRDILDVVKDAESALGQQGASSVHIEALTKALNDVAQVIAPMTLADLECGRDPFSLENQRRSSRLQLVLSIFALLLMLVVGDYMDSLQKEQSAILGLQQFEILQPQLKLTTLRNMAQYEGPISGKSALNQAFQQKLIELRQINSRLFAAYSDALTASQISMVPLAGLFSQSTTGMQRAALPDLSASSAAGANDAGSTRAVVSDGAGNPVRVSTLEPNDTGSKRAVSDGAGNPVSVSTLQPNDVCFADMQGEIILTPQFNGLPAWMKPILREAFGDFCFQLNVLSPAGDGGELNQTLTQLGFLSTIKQKVDLRTGWILPFLFGLLGATVYIMRNVANVRTPTMELFPMIMRLSLGGVAGIVIGWFTAVAGPTTEITKALSLPFALAFLVGYGIDVLFSSLDRLNHMIGEPPKTA